MKHGTSAEPNKAKQNCLQASGRDQENGVVQSGDNHHQQATKVLAKVPQLAGKRSKQNPVIRKWAILLLAFPWHQIAANKPHMLLLSLLDSFEILAQKHGERHVQEASLSGDASRTTSKEPLLSLSMQWQHVNPILVL